MEGEEEVGRKAHVELTDEAGDGGMAEVPGEDFEKVLLSVGDEDVLTLSGGTTRREKLAMGRKGKSEEPERTVASQRIHGRSSSCPRR
jgi:hypothetical protein